MDKNSKRLLWTAGIIFLLSGFLFSYRQKLWDISTSIDAERFYYFGAFVSSLLGIFTIIFIYLTYRQTQQTHQITINTLKQTQNNSLDNTFFNLLQAQQNIVSHLHQRITLEFKLEYVKLSEECGNNNPNQDHKDFFELLYGILDLRYKGSSDTINRSKISDFFSATNGLWGIILEVCYTLLIGLKIMLN